MLWLLKKVAFLWLWSSGYRFQMLYLLTQVMGKIVFALKREDDLFYITAFNIKFVAFAKL